MDRREMLEASLLSGAALLLSVGRTRAADRHPTGAPIEFESPKIQKPFEIELTRVSEKKPLQGVADLRRKENGGYVPNGTVYPQITGNDALTTYPNSLERIVAAQQRNSGGNIQFPPKLFYVLDVRQFKHVFHTDPPYNNGSIIWGYDSQFPGPTFISRHGAPILVRIINSLYNDRDVNPEKRDPKMDLRTIFGNPQISTHLHNGHSGSESDGNPFDIYPFDPENKLLGRIPASIRRIRFRDHHYPFFRAGLNPNQPANKPAPNVNDGDIAESISSLWYHDHSDHFTSENVYKGLAGFHLVFDEVDSCNENDPAHCALRLPSGEFDVPLLFQDKRFNKDGQLIIHNTDPDDPDLDVDIRGFLGDRFTVNGTIQPKMSVKRRRYRFRLLNAGPARFYQFFIALIKGNDPAHYVDQEFFQVGNDESLLPKAVKVKSVLVSVAERADVIVDFSRFKKGDKLYLMNRLVMRRDGSGPECVQGGTCTEFKVLPSGGDEIMLFDVIGDAEGDPSLDLDKMPDKILRPAPKLPSYIPQPLTKKDLPALLKHPNHKCFEFGRPSFKWTINGLEFDPYVPAEIFRPVKDPSDPDAVLDGYIWTIKNESGSVWSHPVHIHLEEFLILLRNGELPGATEACKKDVLLLRPGEEVQIFLRFRDFLGRYPIHCHNVLHEDHTMMLRFDVMG